ncbi:MAG TPA: GAF domain-containing protein [Ktedonobacteraceae bacterium]
MKLFEVPSQTWWKGKEYQKFFAYYMPDDEWYQPIVPESWVGNLSNIEDLASASVDKTLLLQVPSGGKIAVHLSCAPLRDMHHSPNGVVFLFHEFSPKDQQSAHLQRVHEAVLNLNRAIARIPGHSPEQTVVTFPEGSPLMLSPIVFIAQRLVNVIHEVLDHPQVKLNAYEPTGYLYYIAGSGFTAEEGKALLEPDERHLLSEILSEGSVAHLLAKQEAVARGDHLDLPPSLATIAHKTMLIVPLFLEKRLVGMLCVLKEGLNERLYTPEEIELHRSSRPTCSMLSLIRPVQHL